VAYFRCYFSIFNFEKIVPAIRICASSAAFEIAPIHTKPRPFVVCVGAFRWYADDWGAEHVRATREPLARRLRICYMFFLHSRANLCSPIATRARGVVRRHTAPASSRANIYSIYAPVSTSTAISRRGRRVLRAFAPPGGALTYALVHGPPSRE
jgi:hypothetical protein